MLPLAAALIALAAAALCWRRQRYAAAWRAGLLARCAAEVEAPRLGRDRAGFATLRGRYHGAAVDVRLIPDTLVHRRLPQLWLQLTLRLPLAEAATLDILRRPAGAEFYTPDNLPARWPVPASWPADTLVRGTRNAGDLLARVEPALAPILADPLVKEVLLTREGLRLTVQASEGARGAYLLLRGSHFALAQMPPERFRPLLHEGLRLARSLAATPVETRHARAA
ncbi:DUF2470 domain-containing protein [Methylorubrum populi]